MRALFLLVLFFFSVLTGFSLDKNEKLYHKLNKCYQQDQVKCLALAKKMSVKKHTECIPYYFSSLIYYDKSKESPTVRGVYMQLNRSVRSAIKFETYATSSDHQLVNWSDHVETLKTRSEKLLKHLEKQDLLDFADNLMRSLSQLPSLSEYFTPTRSIDILDTENSLVQNEYVPAIERIDRDFFYGLPNGEEKVPSASLSNEVQVLVQINIERTKRGLHALTWNENLSNASRYHAYDQASQKYFSHESKDRIDDRLIVVGDAMDRIKRFYKGQPLAECLAMGSSDTQETVNQWLDSEVHAKIIFDPTAIYVGVGFIHYPDNKNGYYWVLTTGY